MSNQPNNVVDGGIGINNFLKHKNFFVTGSTGFIAKVFVEKLLREVPEVQKVYLLIRAKNADDALQRVKTEIMDCELFNRLKGEHGEKYEEFMRSKLVPVVGNLGNECLIKDVDLAREIADQITVIINVAGNTNWLERYDVLLDLNVRGISRLLEYAMNCKKLVLLLHVSTAYVSTKTDGVVHENPIVMGESIATNLEIPATLDIGAELRMVAELAASVENSKLPSEMTKLGVARAKIHGWSNAYNLVKTMAEMLITTMREKLPTVIIRPSFVESSLKEPFPGWIENYRCMDPIILSYGKGKAQQIFADPTAIIDIVPVDMVASAMMAATAYHGIIGKPGVYVYHVASSMVNPLPFKKLFELCCDYFTLHPLKTTRGEVIKVQHIEYFTSLVDYISVGLKGKSYKTHTEIVRMAATYSAAMFAKLQFVHNNTQDLFDKMSLEEKKIYDFDVNGIDWEDYFMNIHIQGLRKHLLKENALSCKL